MDAHRTHNRLACGDNARMTPATTPAARPPRSVRDGSDGREIELTYCVVNTSQRELLLRGLDAIARERARELPFATEVLVLDNGSRDGSARGGARAPGGGRGDRAATSGAARR